VRGDEEAVDAGALLVEGALRGEAYGVGPGRGGDGGEERVHGGLERAAAGAEAGEVGVEAADGEDGVHARRVEVDLGEAAPEPGLADAHDELRGAGGVGLGRRSGLQDAGHVPRRVGVLAGVDADAGGVELAYVEPVAEESEEAVSGVDCVAGDDGLAAALDLEPEHPRAGEEVALE